MFLLSPPFPEGVQMWPRFLYTLEMGVFEISASSASSPATTIKIGVLGRHRNFLGGGPFVSLVRFIENHHF